MSTTNPASFSPRRTLRELESLWRAEPAHAGLALELGIAYVSARRPSEGLPLLQLAMRSYPKLGAPRYAAGLALLATERVDDAVMQLEYAFRLDPLNVARFVNDGSAQIHGRHKEVRVMLARWARRFDESKTRGYS